MSKNKCKKGEILRDGYNKKGYYRKDYTRKDGTRVKGTYVEGSYVPPTCIIDKGKEGKGPKILPKLKDTIHLTDYGYSVHASKIKRHDALDKAADIYGVLPVLRRLNLIRNYQADIDNKDIMTSDVEYMKNMYGKFKKEKSKEQYGGYNQFETIYKRQKKCADTECTDEEYIHEKYDVNGHQITLYMLNKTDIPRIIDLNKKLDVSLSDKQLENITESNLNSIIGITDGDEFKGYCQYYIHNDKTAEIIRLCAQDGYKTILYKFIEKYFGIQNIDKIFIHIKNPNENISTLNFWFKNGFLITIINESYVNLEKNLYNVK